MLSSKSEVLTIGIIGSNGKTSVADLLSSIFNGAGLSVEVIGCKKDKAGYIELYKSFKTSGNLDVIIIEVNSSMLKEEEIKHISFDMIIHSNISEGTYEDSSEGIEKINSLLSALKGSKTIILNTDYLKWKNIIADLEEAYLVTYGLNNKATVTASSIEQGKEIKFCYCLQRTLTTYNNKIVEPMEIPFEIKALGQYNVYNSIAAITAGLIYGISIEAIAASIDGSKPFKSGVKVLCENGFVVIDNICDTSLSFETGFEAVQNLSYKNINLIFSLNPDNIKSVNKTIIDSVATWSAILKIKNLYFLNTNIDEESQYHAELTNSLKESEINLFNIKGDLSEIEIIIDSLKEHDILLFFCSSNLNPIRDGLLELIDKRILGNISA